MADVLARSLNSFVPRTCVAMLCCVLTAVPTAFAERSEADKIIAAQPGYIVALPELWGQLPKMAEVPLTITPQLGVQMVFADEPEYFRKGDGISLREKVKPGTVRLYVYHVPEPTGKPKTITALIENNSPAPLKMRMIRRAFPKPGRNYLGVGKEGLVKYFASVAEKTPTVIPAGELIPVDPAMDSTTATTDELVHGFYEFEIDQPATIYVLQREPSQSNAEAVKILPLLKTTDRRGSGAGRGLFLTNNFEVKNTAPISTTNGAVKIIVADGKKNDPWIVGTDSIDGDSKQRNVGNYGTLYRMKLKWRSDDGRGMAMFAANQYGDGFCAGQSMAVKVSAGEFPAGIVPIPREQSGYSGVGKMGLIQRFPPVAGRDVQEVELVYSPPGASCLPTLLILVPYDVVEK